MNIYGGDNQKNISLGIGWYLETVFGNTLNVIMAIIFLGYAS